MRHLAIIVCIALVAAVQAAEPPDPAISETGWVVVLDDPRPPRRRGWASGVGYAGRFAYENDPALTRLARAIARDHDVSVSDQWPVRALGVHCLVIDIDGDAEPVLAALRADARVRWVQPLNGFEALEGAARADPYRHLQPALDALNVAPLRDTVTGRGVTIAIVDSGVEADHPDLRHAIVASDDFVGRGSAAERHGTGVAGVVVAAHGNAEGIAGVAPGAALYAYRACWEDADGRTRCNSLTLSRALDRVVAVAPHLLNLSLTGPRDPLLDALIAEVVAAGTLVVAADAGTRPGARFPSPREGVVWAAAPGDAASEAFVAPGDQVLTSQPGHGYDFMSGSSLSAAHITGVLALMHEAMPDDSDAVLLGRMARGLRRATGGDRVDACLAVLGARDPRCALAQEVAHAQGQRRPVRAE